MKLIDLPNYEAYHACVADLLDNPKVQSMRRFGHHPGVNCYEHSVFVSYISFRLARRWRLDYRACARAGLLHDLYLYPWNDQSAHPGNQCLDHPEFALRNAMTVTELSEKEQNIIRAHMWPLSVHLPRSREAWTVSLADKVCATIETVQVWKKMRLRAVLTR